MSLKTQLQAALAYCNEKLAEKGITDTAVSVVDVGDKISDIQQGGWTLLKTVTQESAARSMALPFTAAELSAYDCFLVVGTVTMSKSDWLYLSLVRDNINSDNSTWFGKSSASYNSYTFNKEQMPNLLIRRMSGNNYIADIDRIDAMSNKKYDITNGLYMVCYASNATIPANTELQIYGKAHL